MRYEDYIIVQVVKLWIVLILQFIRLKPFNGSILTSKRKAIYDTEEKYCTWELENLGSCPICATY